MREVMNGGGLKARAARTPLLAALALLMFGLVPANAAAVSGPQLLTFDNYEYGTTISSQYQPQGVLFSGTYPGEFPEIRSDNSNPTSPVLGGEGGFYSPVKAQFVTPGTTTPATVSNLSVDVGFIDDPYSVTLTLYTSTGSSEIYADEFGINTLTSSASNITGFLVEAEDEDQGFAIDNLRFTVPEPPPPAAPPPPPPAAPSCSKYLVIDSRGSGEDNFKLSQPGKAFFDAFKAKLKSLHSSATTAKLINSYPAAKIFGWFPSNILNDANGLGAFMHSDDIGAYKDSEKKGEKILSSWVNAQATGACSSTKMILLGYSQGAEVTGNVYQGLSPAVRKHVAAVVLWGDPQYNHDDARADQDNRPLDGALGSRPLFPTGHGEIVQSFCNDHDPICQWRLPTQTLIAFRTREHNDYWGDSSPRAEGAARKIAELLDKQR